MIPNHILMLILLLPMAGAFVVLLLPKDNVRLIRNVALGASIIPFILSLYVWLGLYQPGVEGFQLVANYQWYPAIGSSFHLGIDGISLTMVLLTTFLTPLAILASYSIEEKVQSYMFLFLFLEMGMLGVFLALDLLLFFVFWEIGLVPMYFLINIWGGKNRNYASLKFILYTMGGSLGLLLSLQMIGALTGTFDLVQLYQVWPGLSEGTLFGLQTATVKAISFWAFVIAFAVKVPVWPFHTWLPDAHTEAPTAGSMILAGVLLKLGAYGFLRLVLPLFPVESKQYAVWLAVLAMLAIIFGALSALAQNDFKRLVAYSSINHMGFVVLGIAVAAAAAGTQYAYIAASGAVLQMVTHGLSAAGMFFLVGVVYERTHTRDLNEYGGLFAIVPVYGSILVFVSMGSLGLPGLAGFVSEYMVVQGAWPVFMLITALSLIGLFFTGAYILKGIRSVLHGKRNEKYVGHLTDMNTRELVVIVPLMALMLLIGIWPSWIVDMINKAVMMLY